MLQPMWVGTSPKNNSPAGTEEANTRGRSTIRPGPSVNSLPGALVNREAHLPNTDGTQMIWNRGK